MNLTEVRPYASEADEAGAARYPRWYGHVHVPSLARDVELLLEATPLGTAVGIAPNAALAGAPEAFAPVRRIPLQRLRGCSSLLTEADVPDAEYRLLGVLDLDIDSARDAVSLASSEELRELPWIAWPRIFLHMTKGTRRALSTLRLPLTDLTQGAAQYGGTDVVPTERFQRASRKIVETLLRSTCRGVLLGGSAGVGKSTLVLQLAQDMATGRMPARLQGVSLVQVDSSAFEPHGGGEAQEARFRDFARLASLPVVLIVDEAHRLSRPTGVGSEALDLLKHLITEFRLRVILCTNETNRLQGRDPALDRRLMAVNLDAADRVELRGILPAKAEIARRIAGVSVDDKALESAVGYSELIGQFAQPHAAVTMLEQAVARAELEGRCGVSEADIASLAREQMGGAPADLETCLKHVRETHVGHDVAISHVVSLMLAHQRRQLSVRAAALPGPFVTVLAGPSGTGKSSLAAALHALRCGPHAVEPFVLRGADFNRPELLTRLLGAAPMYIGHGTQGQLIKAIKRNPRTVIEIAEPELGCSELADRVLMPILDGVLVGNEGDEVVTRGVVVVVTTNLGSVERRAIGFGDAKLDAVEAATGVPPEVTAALRRALHAPVWSRLAGHVVWLGPLDDDELRQIVDRMLQKLADREGVPHVACPELADWIVARAPDLPRTGVRSLEQAFDHLVAEPVAALLLEEPDARFVELRVDSSGVLRLSALKGDSA